MRITWNDRQALIEKDGKFYYSGHFFHDNIPAMLGFIYEVDKETTKYFLEDLEDSLSNELRDKFEGWLKRFFDEGYIASNMPSNATGLHPEAVCVLDGEKYPPVYPYDAIWNKTKRNPRSLEEHWQIWCSFNDNEEQE